MGVAAGGVASATELPPAPTPNASFDVGTLHVDRYGSGARALILIPGLSCGPWEWYGTIAHEAAAYTVYALTLPGLDGRPATAKRPLIGTFVSDLAALLDERKIVKPVLIGHSLGGTLAIAAAETYPGRFRSIVAVDALPVFPTVITATPAQRTTAAAQTAGPLATLTPAQFLGANRQFMAGFGIADPTLVDATAALLSKSDTAAAAAWLQEDIAGDWRPGLGKITIPLTEIMPYYAPDHQQPPLNYTLEQTRGFYQAALAGAPHVTIVPVPNARHFVMLDQPVAFYAALDAALTKE